MFGDYPMRFINMDNEYYIIARDLGPVFDEADTTLACENIRAVNKVKVGLKMSDRVAEYTLLNLKGAKQYCRTKVNYRKHHKNRSAALVEWLTKQFTGVAFFGKNFKLNVAYTSHTKDELHISRKK